MKNDSNNTQNDSQREPGWRPNRKPQTPGFRRSPFSWLIVAIILFTAMMMLQQGLVTNTLRWDEFIQYLQEGGYIQEIQIGDTEITGKFHPDSQAARDHGGTAFKVSYKPESGADRLKEILTDLEKQAKSDAKYKVQVEFAKTQVWMFMLLNWVLPILLLVGFFYFFFARNLRGGAGGMLMSFGRSKHRVMGKDRVKVTFKDVAGIEEAKDEVAEIIEFLKNPRRFQRLGGRIPRGVLLIVPRAAARPCWPRPSPARRTSPSSASPAATSSRCSSASAPRAYAICSNRPRTTPPASSSSTRSTPSAASEARRSSEAATTSGNRPSTRSSSRWTASTRTTR
jgi:cell division protease FtsH